MSSPLPGIFISFRYHAKNIQRIFSDDVCTHIEYVIHTLKTPLLLSII